MLVGDFYFASNETPAKPNAAANRVTTLDPSQIEGDFGERIKESKDAEDFREYLKEYSNGRYARDRLPDAPTLNADEQRREHNEQHAE